MSFLLDTCFLAELIKPQPSPPVTDWLSATEDHLLFISVLTLGEIQKGISRLPDSAKRRRLQTWLDAEVPQRFEDRCLPVTAAVALRWGQVQGEAYLKGRPVPVLDGLIAATALVHDLTIVTRNTTDMTECGARVLNPWGTV